MSATTMSVKSFAQCKVKYNGERCFKKVEEFITSISVFKKIEKISDEDALEGLTLLLTDKAATWWMGVKSETKKWTQALDAIRSAFAPKKQPHEIYIECFGKKQGNETIDEFICEKRALLAQLPAKRQKEEEHLDMVYGLLKVHYKKEIARHDIKTFAELLEKGRLLESLAKEAGEMTDMSERKPFKRCTYCGKKGHVMEVCRKRSAEIKTSELSKPKDKITCYGCGTPGVVRSNCVTCKNKETPPKPVTFCKIQATVENNSKIPTIEVSIKGETGYAYIDTAARISIAGTELYKMLLEKGVNFEENCTQIILADGTIKTTKLLSAKVDIVVGQRIRPITLAAIPEANNNRTLLGIDFLESAGIILNLPQRAWNFIDDPDTTFSFLQLKNENIQLKAAKMITFEKQPQEESLPDFLKWARELTMVSPMIDTPSPLQDPCNPPENKKGRWMLHKLDTPPRPVRPREPADDNSCIDPRINYVPINRIKLTYK